MRPFQATDLHGRGPRPGASEIPPVQKRGAIHDRLLPPVQRGGAELTLREGRHPIVAVAKARPPRDPRPALPSPPCPRAVFFPRPRGVALRYLRHRDRLPVGEAALCGRVLEVALAVPAVDAPWEGFCLLGEPPPTC